jgi:hypothetical protein
MAQFMGYPLAIFGFCTGPYFTSTQKTEIGGKAGIPSARSSGSGII